MRKMTVLPDDFEPQAVLKQKSALLQDHLMELTQILGETIAGGG